LNTPEHVDSENIKNLIGHRPSLPQLCFKNKLKNSIFCQLWEILATFYEVKITF
jgi:hypothetical protein